LNWWIGLRLFMEIAQDATWWFSPLHRMSPDKGVFYCSVCQHWISLMGGNKDLDSAKYWQSMLSLWLLIALIKGLRLFMEFAQDATWRFSPLYRMTTNKGSVCQQWISLMEGKKYLYSAKYWSSMWSLCLWIALIDRVEVIYEVCTGCHLMVFTTS
jgi:hypothetical protein